MRCHTDFYWVSFDAGQYQSSFLFPIELILVCPDFSAALQYHLLKVKKRTRNSEASTVRLVELLRSENISHAKTP